jgi:hypothetical protein
MMEGILKVGVKVSVKNVRSPLFAIIAREIGRKLMRGWEMSRGWPARLSFDIHGNANVLGARKLEALISASQLLDRVIGRSERVGAKEAPNSGSNRTTARSD